MKERHHSWTTRLLVLAGRGDPTLSLLLVLIKVSHPMYAQHHYHDYTMSPVFFIAFLLTLV